MISQEKWRIERWLEGGLFASRWLMAPFYIGLVIGLFGLLVVFVEQVAAAVPAVIGDGRPDEAVVMALSLIDLSLAANLLLIVIFSGYENFVSKMDVGSHEDRPDWMGALDFSGLKMKLIASIVAISAIALLRAFMSLAEQGIEPDSVKLGWMIGLHLVFVASGVLMAAMDWLIQRAGH